MEFMLQSVLRITRAVIFINENSVKEILILSHTPNSSKINLEENILLSSVAVGLLALHLNKGKEEIDAAHLSNFKT